MNSLSSSALLSAQISSGDSLAAVINDSGGFSTFIETESNIQGEINGDKTLYGNVTLGGTYDYNDLYNKPKINGVTLEGDKTSEEINIKALTNLEIEELLSNMLL